MPMPKNKDNLLTCLKNIIFAGAGSCIFFLATAMFLAAIMENNSASERNYAALLLMGIAYPFLLYILHMRERFYTYAEHNNKFDIKAELSSYIRGEGRYFILIYGILALASEIDLLIPRESVGRPIVMICGFVMNSIWFEIPIPFLRSLLAFAYSFVMVCFLAILRSRKVYRNDISSRRRTVSAQEKDREKMSGALRQALKNSRHDRFNR